MTKPKVTATDRLSNVIEVVELARRTGLLAVERGSGPLMEEGEIYFLGGRAIFAALARLRGREALAALARWGECRFAFDTTSPQPAPNVSGPLDGGPVSPLRGSRPGGEYSQPGPISPPGDASGAWRTSARSGATGPLGFGSSGQLPPPITPREYGGNGHSRPLRAPAQNGSQTGAQNGAQNGNGYANMATTAARRPRRAPDVRDLMAVVTSYNLSRAHRTLLLLADGEHTVLDLARLSSKSVDEVTHLLSELEAHGLIYYY